MVIEIPRVLAQRYRAVLRASEMEGRHDWPLVLCRAGPHGLTLEARQGDVSVRHEVAGASAPEAIAFRACVLAPIEGRTESPVGLEQIAVGKGVARWMDGNETRTVECDTVAPESVPCLPKIPRRLAAQSAEFIRALGEAARTAARDAGRLALSRVQLRGQDGFLVSTDGRQLLVQTGFHLPWSAQLLVPRVPAFGLRDLVADGDVGGVGTADGHIAIRAGPWLFLLAVDTKSRFPDVDTVIPKETAVRSRLRLDPADTVSLMAGLPKLPGGAQSHAPVTLDVNHPPCVRAREGPNGPAAELPLMRSTVSGPRAPMHRPSPARSRPGPGLPRNPHRQAGLAAAVPGRNPCVRLDAVGRNRGDPTPARGAAHERRE